MIVNGRVPSACTRAAATSACWRSAGAEAAAAAGVSGEEMPGLRAVQPGLAWAAPPPEQ